MRIHNGDLAHVLFWIIVLILIGIGCSMPTAPAADTDARMQVDVVQTGTINTDTTFAL